MFCFCLVKTEFVLDLCKGSSQKITDYAHAQFILVRSCTFEAAEHLVLVSEEKYFNFLAYE